MTRRRKKRSITAEYFTYYEYQLMLSRLKMDRLYKDELYFIVAFYTALTISELRMVRWCDILGKDQFKRENKKNGGEYNLPISVDIKNRLNELYEILGSPNKESYVLAGNCEKSVTSEYLNRRLKLIRDRYGLDINNISTDTFRKTFGRYVYETMESKVNAIALLNQLFGVSMVRSVTDNMYISQEEISNVFEHIDI